MLTDLNQAALCARFRELTDGNWRNSFYIECTACRHEKEEGCGDFLFVPDEAGPADSAAGFAGARGVRLHRLERMPRPDEQPHVPGALQTLVGLSYPRRGRLPVPRSRPGFIPTSPRR